MPLGHISFSKVQATLEVQNLHKNLLENTPASSAKSLDISFQTARFGKLKSVLMEDMILATIMEKSRSKNYDSDDQKKMKKFLKKKENSTVRFRVPQTLDRFKL